MKLKTYHIVITSKIPQAYHIKIPQGHMTTYVIIYFESDRIDSPFKFDYFWGFKIFSFTFTEWGAGGGGI